jgi:hypothetical protein
MKRLLSLATVAGLLAFALLRSGHADVPRYFGVYRGDVVSAADPLQQGRLEVRVPAVLAARTEWAVASATYVDGTVGSIKLPPVGSAVWVEFEGGDPSFPVWIGWTPRTALPRVDPR